jgi:hypothetical protein
MKTSAIQALRASALIMLAAVVSTPVAAQVSTPKPETVCRKLIPGDRFHPEFQSCCDIDGGHSRWVRPDGRHVDRVSVCALWGIKPGDPALAMDRPRMPERSREGIPPGRYTCTLVGPVKVTIQSQGRYALGDGSSGRFEFLERKADSIGPYARYRIVGGSFNGFFFLHRDNGTLQVGRNGWTRCDPG